MKILNVSKRLFALLLCVIITVGSAKITLADVDNPNLSLTEQLFGLSFHRYHYLDENGKEIENTMYCTSEEDIKNTGILIKKRAESGNTVVDIEIDAARNDEYNKCKPVLIWLHKGDGLFDATKWTDPEKWYDNKLANGTLLLTVIDSSTTEYKATIGIKSHMKDIISSLMDGGYWEVEFYSEDAIPDKLRFAYDTQTMSEDELEEYIQENNIKLQQEWFNTDTGFRPETDGFPFENVDVVGGGGKCAGYAYLAIMKFLGLRPPIEDEVVLEHDWADVIYGDSPMDDLDIESVKHATPSLNINDSLSRDGYTVADKKNSYWSPITDDSDDYDLSDSDTAFFSLLEDSFYRCNAANKLLGPAVKDNHWSYVELMCGKLSEGIPVIVSPHVNGGGHALVAYKSEMIDDDTVRVYVYDCNRPDDFIYRYLKNSKGESIEDTAWVYSEEDASKFNYIDFTKVEVEEYIGNYKFGESYKYNFDSNQTSFQTSTEDGGTLKFVFVNDNGKMQYMDSSESRMKNIISCNAKYTMEGNTATVRLFGTYNSGEIFDITNEKDTHLEMDYSYIGQYKIKDNKIILLDENKQFTNENTGEYIEFTVVHSTKESRRGETRCRLYVESK
ncbi:MAG: hypothetical protein J6L69_02030 [Lachnospiraceae bacterium]|nr:hypothetical protein [Lachnospiraceae bacterium]